jgi:hypothetical protein
MEHGVGVMDSPRARTAALQAALVAAALFMSPPGFAQASPDSRLKESLARRIQAADRALHEARSKASGNETVMAVVSFSTRLPPSRIASLVGPCDCSIFKGFRSVGDMQMSLGIDRETLLRRDGEAFIARAFSGEGMMPPPPPMAPFSGATSESEKLRQAAEDAEIEKVMATARNGHIVLDGVLLRGPLADVLALRDRAGGDILAIEFVGRQIPFAIPLDQYQRR